MKKLTRKQIDDFNNEVLEILEFYGLEKVESNESYSFGCYEIDSVKVGKLSVKIDTDLSPCYTIYAKFTSPEKAIQYFKEINPYSGKHNIHTRNDSEALYWLDSLINNIYNIHDFDYHENYDDLGWITPKEALMINNK